MALTLRTGQKGRFKASGVEFEIVSTQGTTTTIRYRNTKDQYEINDADLRPNADDITGWGIRPEVK